MRKLSDWLKELRQREVVTAAGLYIAIAWGGTEILGFVLDAYGFPRWYRALLASLFIAGFPVAMLLAWHFDVSAEGIRTTGPISGKGRLTLLAAGLLFIGGTAGLFYLFAPGVSVDNEVTGPQATVDAPANSIAVLPFVNMSDDQAQEYFSDGMSEELLHRLAQISELQVAARTSAFHFKNKDVALADIAARLGVRSVLEGSVRKSGTTIRVTAQLINASDGFHIWSKTYDRESGDIFAIQDEIAIQVVDALRVTLLGSEQARLERHPTANLAAYDAYLLGRQQMARRTSGALNEAVTHFSNAIELDPEFALAYVGLADAYILQGRYGVLDQNDVYEKSRPIIDHALVLDDQLGEAHASQGTLLFWQRDFAASEQAYTRALQLNPNYAPAYEGLGLLMRWGYGRTEEALKLHRTALVLDPLSTPINMAVVEDYHELGRFEEALAGCRRTIEMDPDYPRPYTLMADLYWEVFAELDEGVRWLHKAVELDPGNPDHARWLGMVYLDLGDLSAGEYWMLETIRLAPTQMDSKWAAVYLALYKGRFEETAAAAEDLLAALPDAWIAVRALRYLDDHGNGENPVLRRHRTARPDLFDSDNSEFNFADWQWTIEVAGVLGDDGEQQAADFLLSKAMLALRSKPRLGYGGFGISDVEIHTLLGNKEKALGLLANAVKEGWRASWWLNTEANRNLASLHDEPRYLSIIAGIQSQMAEQLEQVRRWEAEGILTSVPRPAD